MSTGKVRTLFTDKTQTEALFPKTKISAVSDNEGVGLEAILSQMVSAGDNLAQTSSEIINADTLNGMSANDFASKSDVTDVIYAYEKNIDSVIAPVDADTLGGYPAEDYATQVYVKNEIANAQFNGGEGGGSVDLSGFATKDDIANLNKAIKTINYPVYSVNGKTGAVGLSAEDVGARPDNWMPTAQDVGARPDNWMPTAQDVGARPNTWIPSAEDVGAAESSHEHAASDITSGTLGVARGGTGRATLTANAVLAGNTTSAVKQIATASGALYATAANGAAKFGTLPFEQGGTNATSRLDAAKALTNEAVSSPNYVVSLTNSWGKFGYTSLAQLMTALGAASATPSVSSANNSYHYAHFVKIGKLVICSLLPKTVNTQALYEETITVPSGYRPAAAKTFTIYSDTAKNAGSSNGQATVSVATGGTLKVACTYGISVNEASKTFFWATS